jgi:molybdate transport system permease protein
MTDASAPHPPSGEQKIQRRSDAPFLAGLAILGGSYLLLIVATLAADAWFTSADDILRVFASPEIRFATKLSLISSTLTTILALWTAVPIGYLLSRFNFWGKGLIDAVLDIPIVLPPLVIGVSLLIVFQTPPGQWLEGLARQATEWWTGRPSRNGIVFAAPGVVLAQFMVAAAFAVRTMRTTFDEISPRKEQVAWTLGCSRAQAFFRVVMPEAAGGVLAAATLTWARALGEFGPILVFAGSTRFRTEVLPTSVFLLLSVGDLEEAVAVSLFMVIVAIVVLVIVRMLGGRNLDGTLRR